MVVLLEGKEDTIRGENSVLMLKRVRKRKAK